MGRRRVSRRISSNASSVVVATAYNLDQSIRTAIHQGVDLFNQGHHQQCFEIYLATAYAGLSQQTMMHYHNADLQENKQKKNHDPQSEKHKIDDDDDDDDEECRSSDELLVLESQYISKLLTTATQQATASAAAVGGKIIRSDGDDGGNKQQKNKNYTKAAWILRRAFDKILRLKSEIKVQAATVEEVQELLLLEDKEANDEEDEGSTTDKNSNKGDGDAKQKQHDVIGSSAEEEEEVVLRKKAQDLSELCNAMERVLDIGVHRFRLKAYPDTFVGHEAVTQLIKAQLCRSRSEAIDKMNELLRYGLLYHVTKEHAFKDEALFYKLASPMELRRALDDEMFVVGHQTSTNGGNSPLQGDTLVHYATLLGRYKHFHTHPSLGVLRLDYSYPPAPGDIDHPDSYTYPVYYRVVPGLSFEMCQAGEMTPEVAQAFDEAVLWLADHKDVSVITGDCGFMFWFVERVRAMIKSKKVISLSPLMQLPSMVAACGPHDKILVLTANGTSLDPMHDLIKRQCGIDGQDTQFIFVGCENVPHFGAEVAQGLQVDVVKAEPGIVALAEEMVRAHPDTRMILFECTELPPYSDAVRAATRLPVMDAITNCDFFMTGFLDNQAFGLNGWYEEWDGRQEEYVLGQNLTDNQKLQCVWCQNNELNYTNDGR